MQNVEETKDLRVRRTRKLLQQALMELTVEKGFLAVTIHDLTERAMINRSTFYRHYLDKYDLLEQYMQEVYELVALEAPPIQNAGETGKEVPYGLINLLKHIQRYADFYRVMFGAKGDPAFTQHFRRNSEKRFRYLLSTESIATTSNLPPLSLRVNYVSYAGIGAIVWWLENGQPCSAEQLAEWLGQFSTKVTGLSPQESRRDG
ncbi:MAG: TetR/AcrR family transcriptional regulator [Chloroflexota bacterium]